MKILILGDPHGYYNYPKKIFKNIDLILITGDLGKATLARKFYFDNIKRKQEGLSEIKKSAKIEKKIHMEIYNSTIKLLKMLSKYAPVYTIQGNVGIPTKSECKEQEKKWKIKFPCTKEEIKKIKNVYLTKNILRKINGLKIGFLEYFLDTGWMKEFNQFKQKKKLSKAEKETKKAKKILKTFKNLDILVCHQPPFGILDKVSGKFGAPKQWIGKKGGSKVILNYIKKEKPKYVFCGHIHEAKGKKRLGKTKIYNMGHSGDYIILNI